MEGPINARNPPSYVYYRRLILGYPARNLHWIALGKVRIRSEKALRRHPIAAMLRGGPITVFTVGVVRVTEIGTMQLSVNGMAANTLPTP